MMLAKGSECFKCRKPFDSVDDMVLISRYRIQLYAYCKRCAINQNFLDEDAPAVTEKKKEEKEVMSDGKEPIPGFSKDEKPKLKEDVLKNVVEDTTKKINEVKKDGEKDKGKATA